VRLALQGFAVLLAVQVAIILYPDPLFAYAHTSGSLTIHSDAPIDATGADAIFRSVRARLAASPLPLDGERYHLYVSNDDWRRRLLFLWAYDAGGVVHTPLAPRSAFFSGANFRTDQLRSPSGRWLSPPRTFSYFAAHEIAHLLEAKRAPWRHLLRPEWIREGLADYSALGPVADVAALRRALGDRALTVEDWDAHGYYVRYRLLVTYFLKIEGWDRDRLLASDLSEADARHAMDAWIAAHDGGAGAL
jgi:hypothetical protein